MGAGRPSDARALRNAPGHDPEMGTPMGDHNHRKRVFNRACKAAGIPWATPHKPRHGLAPLWPSGVNDRLSWRRS